jgi:hypothetical protein
MATATASPNSVVEYIRSLTTDEKKIALAELIEEVIRSRGDHFVQVITKPNGESLGYYVPPGAVGALRVRIPDLTPEEKESINVALATPDDTFDMDEFLGELKRQDPD